ncbi:hypothetical protein KO525_09070 [Psychrosphaera sp. B3R10]|uniref:hypothetical protein n=1 Tax=unclassified Psychrosphaera TaxID=2641570 RepID=UPI001C08F7FA|nr:MULTISPECIES: hypothetical protein [unclassified Psychrosphaera]MBU2881463.1 hypothetical protein [Psychrosphaera sp. I2R16]MBU2989525.1 hypothetical protein [Psychrosphaera sp. B3R10]
MFFRQCLIAIVILFCGSTYAVNPSAPSWAVDSYVEGYVTGLGIGKLKPNKKHAERFRDKAAEMMAKANLAKQFEIHIDSKTYASRGKNVDPKIRVDTIQTSITSVLSEKTVEELKRWVDPKTGTLYLLIGIKHAE